MIRCGCCCCWDESRYRELDVGKRPLTICGISGQFAVTWHQFTIHGHVTFLNKIR
jgi:hypothetical protein